MTSPVSIMAYRNIPDLEDRQRRVYSCISDYPDVSSNDISRIMKMEVRNVRSRVGELLKNGDIVVSGEKTDRLTGRTVRKYRAADRT